MEVRIAGKYKLLKTIGQGGFGDVYKTEESKSGAIKAIKLERRASGDMIFFESRVLQYLKDVVGIPRVHDFGFEGDFNYMVMDYCGFSVSALHELCDGKFSLKVDIVEERLFVVWGCSCLEFSRLSTIGLSSIETLSLRIFYSTLRAIGSSS